MIFFLIKKKEKEKVPWEQLVSVDYQVTRASPSLHHRNKSLLWAPASLQLV